MKEQELIPNKPPKNVNFSVRLALDELYRWASGDTMPFIQLNSLLAVIEDWYGDAVFL